MYKRCGTIYPYLAILATGWWLMAMDEITALSHALREWQEDNSKDQAEAQLAIALTRVVEKMVRPSLIKKLKPEDVDDVCSEVILGFWKFRQSVRPDETGKLVNTLVQRKLNDQLRGIYRDAEHVVSKNTEDKDELLALVRSRHSGAADGIEHDTWELINGIELSARDHLVVYMVCEGVEKQVVSEMLGINASTIARSLARCRKTLTDHQSSDETKDSHA